MRISDWSSDVCSSYVCSSDLIPAPRLASVTQPARAKNVSDYVVQLGAFSSAHSVNQAWKQISAQFPHIRGYTTFGNTAKINGRTFYRLALSGFDSRQDAQKTCSALRAKGSRAERSRGG